VAIEGGVDGGGGGQELGHQRYEQQDAHGLELRHDDVTDVTALAELRKRCPESIERDERRGFSGKRPLWPSLTTSGCWDHISGAEPGGVSDETIRISEGRVRASPGHG